MLFQPKHNVWRIEKAARAAVLIDAANYFLAVREALLKAERCVFIVGWDIHSQTPLVGATGKAEDGFPIHFRDFMTALVERKPNLVVNLLLWDFAMLYAVEREPLPHWTLGWKTPDRVRFRLDRAIPFGAAQHQKLVVVDDSVAFSGGLDITIRRWDTPEHDPGNPLRVDPAGNPYRPFHDVQAVVDGPAAKAIGEIARARWECAEGVDAPACVSLEHDAWPDSTKPDFQHVAVAISRTQPAYEGQEDIREVEQMFFDSIDAAERSIYIENQFLTCASVAQRLAKRMKENPKLEVLIVSPQRAESWVEARSMRNGRIRFTKCLEEAGVIDRVRIRFPAIGHNGQQVDTMIHSKVMVVDDWLLRIGSANLNNRSMATDTECDLLIEGSRPSERAAITRIRDTLIGEHCGLSAEEAAREIATAGSLVAAADVMGKNERRLLPVEDGEPDASDLAKYIGTIADPEKPLGRLAFGGGVLEMPQREGRITPAVKLIGAALVLGLLLLAWHLTPLAKFANLDFVQDHFADFADSYWAPFLVLGVFVLAGLIVFPVTILIAATAAAFGPWLGLLYATAGAMLSAFVTYGIGARLGSRSLEQLLGARLIRVKKQIAKRGVLAIAAIRLVPIAPFTMVNLAAGASRIRPFDYLAGSLIGLAPGLVVLSVLGSQILHILSEPTPASIVLFGAAVGVWIAVTLLVQIFIARFWSVRA